MKVCIITEGNSDIGYGHITRCTSLYQAFEEKGIEPFFIVNGDENVKNTLNTKRNCIFNWLINTDKLFGIINGSDIVVLDSYLATLLLYKKISEVIKIPVFIDDNLRLEYPPGVVVNYSISAKKIKYHNRENINYLLGPKYCLVRNEFWNVQNKIESDEIKTIMITLGGSDTKNLTPPILEMLNTLFPNLEKKVIVGMGFKNIDNIEAVLDKNCELIYFPTAEDMKKVMRESDLAITAGGTTIYELAIIGVPAISVAVADNQLNNVKAFSELGINYFAGWWQNKNLFENIKKFILLLKNKERRKKMVISGQKHIKSDGSRSIIEYILNKLNGKSSFE